MPKYSKNYYKQLIAHGKIEQLTEALLQDLSQYLALANDAPLQNTYDQLIMLSGKLKGLQQQEDLNIANPLTAPIEKSRIDRALMRLINGLPQHFFDFLNSDRQSLPPARPDLRQQITDIHKNSHFEYDVFLSFSSQDLAEAQAVAEELRGYGLSLFLSDEVLKANTGSSFFEKIDYALHHSQHFVLLSSPAAMASEWVKTEYETFFNEYHIKNKRQRRFIVLKSQAFQLELVPRLLRRLQFAATAKDILETFVQDKAFQERQRAKAAKKAEEKAKAEEAAKRAAEASVLEELQTLKSQLKQLKNQQSSYENAFFFYNNQWFIYYQGERVKYTGKKPDMAGLRLIEHLLYLSSINKEDKLSVEEMEEIKRIHKVANKKKAYSSEVVKSKKIELEKTLALYRKKLEGLRREGFIDEKIETWKHIATVCLDLGKLTGSKRYLGQYLDCKKQIESLHDQKIAESPEIEESFFSEKKNLYKLSEVMPNISRPPRLGQLIVKNIRDALAKLEHEKFVEHIKDNIDLRSHTLFNYKNKNNLKWITLPPSP